MKTRLATIILAISASMLSAQEPAPATSPSATPAAQPQSQDAPSGIESATAASGTATEAAAATPAPDAPAAGGGMTLSGTTPPTQNPDSSLFSEPNLESTAPDSNFIDVPPPSDSDRMPPGGPTFRKTKTSENVEEVKLRIRVRQVKTRAMQDPKVQEAMERADAAQTVPERRDAMRDYYNALYDRMVRLDSSVKKSVDELRRQSLKRLDDSAYGLAKKSRGFRR